MTKQLPSAAGAQIRRVPRTGPPTARRRDASPASPPLRDSAQTFVTGLVPAAIATLPYRVVEATLGGDSAKVTIAAVRSRTGIAIRTPDLGVRPANVVLRAPLRATIPEVTYRWSAEVTGATGNPQSFTGGNRLVVK